MRNEPQASVSETCAREFAWVWFGGCIRHSRTEEACAPSICANHKYQLVTLNAMLPFAAACCRHCRHDVVVTCCVLETSCAMDIFHHPRDMVAAFYYSICTLCYSIYRILLCYLYAVGCRNGVMLSIHAPRQWPVNLSSCRVGNVVDQLIPNCLRRAMQVSVLVYWL